MNKNNSTGILVIVFNNNANAYLTVNYTEFKNVIDRIVADGGTEFANPLKKMREASI